MWDRISPVLLSCSHLVKEGALYKIRGYFLSTPVAYTKISSEYDDMVNHINSVVLPVLINTRIVLCNFLRNFSPSMSLISASARRICNSDKSFFCSSDSALVSRVDISDA